MWIGVSGGSGGHNDDEMNIGEDSEDGDNLGGGERGSGNCNGYVESVD